MSYLLEKYLAKATEDVSDNDKRKHDEITIDGDVWPIRSLTVREKRMCVREANKSGQFDAGLFNDAVIVKATEHHFNWNDERLKKQHGAKTKFELPSRVFDYMVGEYEALLEKVNKLNESVTEKTEVEEAKN